MTAIEQCIREIESSDDVLIKIEGDFELGDLIQNLNDREHHAVIIDRAPVNNKETLMHALYQALRFPGYFGFTWDGLKDVLAGIEGEPGRPLYLAFHDLSLLDEDDLRIFLDVVEDANELREAGGKLRSLRVLTLA